MGADRRKGPSVRQSRITSYNVCYTKLLRLYRPSGPRQWQVTARLCVPTVSKSMSCTDVFRITSYTVSYTTLLRGRCLLAIALSTFLLRRWLSRGDISGHAGFGFVSLSASIASDCRFRFGKQFLRSSDQLTSRLFLTTAPASFLLGEGLIVRQELGSGLVLGGRLCGRFGERFGSGFKFGPFRNGIRCFGGTDGLV